MRARGMVVVACAVFMVLVGACESDSTATRTSDHGGSPPTSPLPAGDDATVTRVVDGDTIVVRVDGRVATVRLIGIDTPETKDPRKPVQCFGREASAHTGELLPVGAAVRLAYDVERNDRYGRTLAYVYRVDRTADAGKGSFVNAALVRDGYASSYTYPPNVAHADEFVALQHDARDAGRGLWGACPVTSEPEPEPTGDGCDPAYPDGCIPPPPPDLDCSDISERGFRVLAPDPHHFDSNGDGIGCEGPPTR
jgi:micrococcal nuclease